MKTYLTSRAAAIAFGVVVALLFSGVAQAITDTVFRYTTPKAGFYTIDPSAMNGRSHDTAYTHTVGQGLESTSGMGCFNAGVNLPHGATITAVTVFYSSANFANLAAHLYRHNLLDGTENIIATREFIDNSSTRKAGQMPITASFEAVNNNLYTISFGICLGTDDAFYAARIAYSYAHAGD